MVRGTALLVLVLSASLLAQTQTTTSPDVLLKAAMQREQVEGDLPGALALYKDIVDKFPKDPAAPKALLQMAGIHERQGDRATARTVLERIVREYSNSGAVASDAARRLNGFSASRLKETELSVTGRAEDMLGEGRVSPDGKWISFADQLRQARGGTGNMAAWNVESGATVVINKVSNQEPYKDGTAWDSVWSPDGRQVAYAWQPAVSAETPRSVAGELRIVTRADGRHRTVVPTDGKRTVAPMAWSPDGRQLLVSWSTRAGDGTVARAELALVSVRDGDVRSLKSFEGAAPRGAVFSPDGRHVAFDFQPGTASPARDIAVLNLESGRQIVVANDRPGHETLLGWLLQGYLLFSSDRDGTTDAWTLRMENGAPEGPPQVVKRDVGQLMPQGVTRDGRVFVWKQAEYREVLVAELDPVTGRVVGPVVPMPGVQPGVYRGEPAWSPDGTRIAYVQAAPGMAQQVVVRTWATGQSRTYPVPVRNIDWPLWDPRGDAFIFDGTGGDNVQRTFRLDLPSGRVDTLTDRIAFGISRDGEWIYQGTETCCGLDRRHVTDRRVESVWSGMAQGSTLSPDGRWFAFLVRAAGGPSVHILSVDGTSERVLTEPVRVGYPRLTWSGDSRYVIFNKNPGGLHRVSIDGGTPEPLGIDNANLGTITEKSASADGRWIALGVRRNRTELWVWENVVPKSK